MSDERVVRRWAPILGEVRERDSNLGSPIRGAFEFHQWTTKQLPPSVRAHYGEFFVLGANHLLADDFTVLSGIRKLFYGKPTSIVSMTCLICPCGTKVERADCLIYRFKCAFESITSERIAEWYVGLFVPDAINVRAFFRAVAPSIPLIRKARDLILAHELVRHGEGPTEDADVSKNRGAPRKTLRDAFAVTAMIAVHEQTGIALVNTGSGDDCAARVACKFGVSPKTLRRRWNDVAPEVRESIKLRKPLSA